MASREYFIGKYEEYYNSLSGEASASGKASEFVTEVSNLVTEFNNVSQIMIYWSGEAKDAMSSQSITAILEKFKTTQENLQEALLPCCEAIDSLSQNLSNMKTTEDSWLQLKNDLERKMNSKPRERIEEGGVTKDNPKYKTWKKEVDSLEQQISALKSNLDQIKQLCDADIEKIETLEQSLQEFTDYMTLTNSIMGINSEFSSYTLEQRLQYLQELIDNYQEIYNSLNTLYEQKYGKGFQFTGEDFKKLDFLFDAFDIYWMSKVDRNTLIVSNTREPILLNIEKLTQIISYCNMNDVFGKINSYMNGASWKDSGLESLYDNGQFYDTNSANFMNFNIYNEDRFKQRLRDKYGVKGDVREYLKQNYDSVVSSYQNLMTSYGEYQKLTSAMAEVKSKIDNIKEAKKLMPYEILMENGDFKSYLTADYS